MKKLYWILILLVTFFLQMSVFPYFSLLGIVPNMGLLILCISALFTESYFVSVSGLMFGLAQDILFSDVIGVHALLFFLAGIGTAQFRKKDDDIGLLLTLGYVVGISIAYNLCYYFIMRVISVRISLMVYMKERLLLEILLNVVFSIPIYYLMKKILVHKALTFGTGSR